MASTNPVFRNLIIPEKPIRLGPDAMTLNVTIYRAGFLLSCAGAAALWAGMQERRGPGSVSMLLAVLVSAVPAALLVWATVRNKEWAVMTAPPYALLEGLVLGTVGASGAPRYRGIATEAVALTFATCLFLLLLYRSGLNRVTARSNATLVGGIGGAALLFLATLVLHALGVKPSVLLAGGVPGALIGIVVAGFAALSFVSNLELIETCANRGAPRHTEWYAALGFVVTLAWVYVEILRSYSKAARPENHPPVS